MTSKYPCVRRITHTFLSRKYSSLESNSTLLNVGSLLTASYFLGSVLTRNDKLFQALCLVPLGKCRKTATHFYGLVLEDFSLLPQDRKLLSSLRGFDHLNPVLSASTNSFPSTQLCHYADFTQA